MSFPRAYVRELTGERLGRGSLSSALARLQAKELIEPLQAQGRQRPLRLTAAGRQVLERELRSAVRVADRMFEAAAPDTVHYQERLAASAAARAYKAVMFRALDVRDGSTVLDLGCGAGSDLMRLAESVTAAGRVVGIDHDPAMVDRARARTRGSERVSVVRSDAHALPLRAACVDRIWTDRLLQHVTDPDQVLEEGRRVLRPRGRLIMAEPDWESLAFDHPDQVSEVCPVTAVLRDPGEADQILGLRRNATRAVQSGYLTASAAREWLDTLAREPFLAAVTLYVVNAVA